MVTAIMHQGHRADLILVPHLQHLTSQAVNPVVITADLITATHPQHQVNSTVVVRLNNMAAQDSRAVRAPIARKTIIISMVDPSNSTLNIMDRPSRVNMADRSNKTLVTVRKPVLGARVVRAKVMERTEIRRAMVGQPQTIMALLQTKLEDTTVDRAIMIISKSFDVV